MNTTAFNNNPFQPKKKKQVNRPTNFVEALKSIGGETARSIKEDVVKASLNDFAQALKGAKSNENQPQQQLQNEWIQQREEQMKREQLARKRHQEIINAEPLFDRRKQEVEAKINQVRQELQMLIREIANLSEATQRAVNEQIVDPGAYHLSYFEKLREHLVLLRKEVGKSANWLAVSSQRKQAQNHYWGKVKKHGTQFMLSQERSKVTQTG